MCQLIISYPVSMFGGGFGLCRVTTSYQVSSRYCSVSMKPNKKFLFRQDENYLVSHILGLAALSLLKVSNTIGNDNIVKVCLDLWFSLYPRRLFAGFWGGRGGANSVLEPGRDLRQEGGGPGGDGAHCGIGPSSSGPILSSWWPFWSWG